jgi:ribonuclease Z
MPKLIILGSSTNVPDIHHENTHMVLVGDDHMVLIDGPGNPFVRIREAGLDETKLTDIIMTHFHPDHVSGIPLLLMAVGISGRKNLLNLYANEHCLGLMHKLLKFYEWDSWHSFPVESHTIPEEKKYLLMEADGCKVFSFPVRHFIPTIGLRFEFPKSGKILAYSCDTAPTPSLIDLGKDADVFIHEAAGMSHGHSSARQAGEVASEANAKSLYLIHYPTGDYDYQTLIAEAAEVYNGPISLAEDFMEFDF